MAALLARLAIATAAVGPLAIVSATVVPRPRIAQLGLWRLGSRAPFLRLCAAGQVLVEEDAAPPIAVAKAMAGRAHHERLHADFAVVRSMEVPLNMTAGTRLPVALILLAPDQFGSLSRARKTVRRSGVLINGVISDCASAVSPGDAVELRVRVNPGYIPRGVPPFPVTVIYEDDHLAVVFKPAGVVTHPPPGGATGSRSMRTAITYALAPPPAGTPEALYRPHLVHRLDRPTSGLMLAAKTKPAQTGLQRLFASRAIGKRYSAIVAGRVPQERGLIDSPVGGREARTRFEVACRHRSLRIGGGHLTTLRLYPQTGRTHQLRIHCAQVLGCPIVGDTAYGYGRGKPTLASPSLVDESLSPTLSPPPPSMLLPSQPPSSPLSQGGGDACVSQRLKQAELDGSGESVVAGAGLADSGEDVVGAEDDVVRVEDAVEEAQDDMAGAEDDMLRTAGVVVRAADGIVRAEDDVAGSDAGRQIDAEYGVNGLYLSAVGLEFPHPCCADEAGATPEGRDEASTNPMSIPERRAVAGKRMLFEVEEPDKFRTLRQREQRRWDKFYGGAAAGDDGAVCEGAGAGEDDGVR